MVEELARNKQFSEDDEKAEKSRPQSRDRNMMKEVVVNKVSTARKRKHLDDATSTAEHLGMKHIFGQWDFGSLHIQEL